MNIRGGLSSPQDNGFWFMGSWIPSTPEKLIPPRSNPPPYDRYEYPFGGENWQSSAGTSNVYSQTIQSNNVVAQHSNLMDNMDRGRSHYGDLSEINQMGNYKGPSFQALLQSEGPGWNAEVEEFLREDTDFVPSANRPMFPGLHSQGGCNFEEIDNILINQQHQYHTSQSRHVENLQVKLNAFPQLDGNREHTSTKRMLPPPDTHSLGSFSFNHSCDLLPQYEFLSSRKPNYDQNLEQRLLANTMPSKAKSLNEVPSVSPSIMSGDQILELLNFPIDEQSSHEKNQQEILITTIEEETQRQCDGLLQNIVDSSSAAMSTLHPEMCESVKGVDQGIYLKETPPQKNPKRRKHRPKVITEGKPKRTPKPTSTDKSTEKPSGKRKYVRRKGLNELETPPVDIKVKKYSTTEPAAKSCRRSLNFDAGNSGNNSQSKQLDQEMPERYKWGFDNIESLPSEFCTRGNDVCGTSLTLQIGQQDNFRVESMPSRLLSQREMLKDYSSPAESNTAEIQSSPSIEHNADSSHAIRRILEKENLGLYQNRYKKPGNAYMPQNLHLEAEKQLTPSIEHNLDNSDVIKRILEKENSDICQNRSKPGRRDMNQNFHVEAMWKFFNQTKDCYVQKKPAGIMLHNTQLVPKISTNPFETRGWKRNYPYSIVQADICSRTAPRSQLLGHDTRHVDENLNGHNLCGSPLNIQKKKKLESEMCADIGYSSLKIKTLGAKSSENRQERMNVLTGSTNGRNIKQLYWEKNFPKQPSELLLIAERMGKGQPYMSNVDNPNLLPPPSLRKSPIKGAEQANTWKSSVLKRKQCTKPIVHQLNSSALEKDQDGEFYYSFEQSKGSPADDIIRQMKSLDLNERSNDQGGQAQAIVPYNGFHEMVPYVGSNFIKKRIPRPKVDLDPDTERVWNLIMGKEGSEGLETNKEKEKWWEEEREVFRGRADSFIARMHLVQGDRRFSRWKGSVIDSVVGVFLTQNVSDHLSSSAFMSLASRYPPKANIHSRVSKEDDTNISIHEQDISPITSDDSTLWCKEVMDEQSFSRPQYSTEHQRDDPASEGAKSSIETQRQNVEEEVISSQDSDSSVTQCLGIRSCSGSNSEAEDCPTGYTSIKNYGPDSKNSQTVSNTTYFSKFHGHVIGNSNLDEIPRYRPEVDKIQGAPSSGLDKIAKIYGRPDLNSPPTNNDSQPPQGSDAPSDIHVLPVIPDTRILEVEGCETFGEETTYCWPSISSELTMAKDLTSLSFGELGKITSRNREKQNGLPGSQETPCISIQSIGEHTTETSCVSSQLEFHMAKDLTSLSFGELGKITSRNTEKQNGLLGSQETPCISIQSISEHAAQTSCVSTQSEFHMGRDKLSPNQQLERSQIFQSESTSFVKPSKASEDKPVCSVQRVDVPEQTLKINKVGDTMPKENNQSRPANGLFGQNSNGQSHSSLNTYKGDAKISKVKGKAGKERNIAVDWDNLRKQVFADGVKKERSKDTMDSLDYEAVRLADVSEIAETIKERGMNNLLAERIKEFLNRVLEEHGSLDLEWLRDVPPDKAKDYLLSIRGIGLKSVECVRLLTLHHLAFPVDTNVGRIAVRLGWVPLRPLPESLQLHLLELYPVLESIQKFLWPRLCKLDQRTLYELHYQLITFGKVFCTKSKPNCNACPMRGECRHFASAFASIIAQGLRVSRDIELEEISARLALPGPEERGIVSSTNQIPSAIPHAVGINPMPLLIETGPESTKCEPIIEVPVTPEQECPETCGSDIEDSLFEDPDDIPIIKLNIEELKTTLQNFIPEGDMSMALVALNSAAASIPTPKLKNVSRLRTEHQVYELPDSHPLLEGMDKREPDDPSPFLLAIWKPGETADSIELEGKSCASRDTDGLCNGETCFSCNSIKEANSQTVRGTILVPCRTAMRGSFPLNGTYFQVNEVFADHESSHKPIAVPRAWIWNLPRRTVYFGTSVTTIFKGLSTEGIQYCFWRGFVCVRGFDQKTRAPRPLSARLHFPASKLTKTKNEKKQ